MQDAALVLSNEQAVTASAASTNILDEGVAVNTGYPMIAETRVNVAMAGSGTLTVEIQASDTTSFSNKVILGNSGSVAAADLTAGKAIRVPLAFNPKRKYRYIRAYYTASSAFTSGKLTTVIQPAVQTNFEG